MEDILNAV